MNPVPLAPSKQLLKMWRTVNAVSFLILLIFPAVLVIAGAPIVVPLIFFIAWVVLFLSISLYLPAFYRSLEYSIDADAVRLKKGVFWKRRTTVPYAKITNIDITQGPVERHYQLSKLHIQTAGSNTANNPTAEIMMYGITDPEAAKDQIMGRIQKPAATEVAGAASSTDAQDTLQAILQELRAIRKAVEK